MKRNVIILFLVLNPVLSFAQTILTIEGTTTNSTVTGNWAGVEHMRGEWWSATDNGRRVVEINFTDLDGKMTQFCIPLAFAYAMSMEYYIPDETSRQTRHD